MKPELKDLNQYKDYDIVPVYEELFSDSTTPLNVLRNIKEISDQFYLLESVDPSKFSRYSYLGYNPIHKISCKDNKVIFDGYEYYSNNPIDEISKVLNDYKVINWDGFDRYVKDVLDGDSFSFYLKANDDISVRASGYMTWPKNYNLLL